MTEYSGFQVGAFVAPLTSSTANELLQDADPALWATLGFVQAMLSTYLGARFDAEVTKAGLPALAGRISSLALHSDPLPRLQQAQLEPPFLAVFPTDETFAERTRNWPHVVGNWKLLYVLPPLSPAQAFQLEPMLRAIGKTIFDRVEQGHDPSYRADALFCELGGIEQIKIVRARYGSIQGLQTALWFPSLEMELEVQERKMGAPAAQTPLEGLDATTTVTDADGVSNPLTVAATSQDFV